MRVEWKGEKRMITVAERVIKTQRENIKKAHNARFKYKDMEYRISYDGGLAEFFSIHGRKVGTEQFKYVAGFNGYKYNNKEQVIAHARLLMMNKN